MKKIVFILMLLFCGSLRAEKVELVKTAIFADDYVAKDYPMMVAKNKMIDDGQKIYTGSRHGAIYYYDAGSMELQERKAPIQDFFSQNTGLLNDAAGFAKKPYPHEIKDVVYYSERLGKAGLLVEDVYHHRPKNTYTVSHYLLTWDLKKNEIIKADLILKNSMEHHWSWEIDKKNPPAKGYLKTNKPLIAVGYDEKKDAAYFMIWHWSSTYNGTGFTNSPQKFAEFVELKNGTVKTLAKLPYDKHDIGNHNFFNPDSGIILAIEYWEGKFSNGYAYVIDVKTKKVSKINTPLNTYSAVFDPDLKRVYLQSIFKNLWVVDLKTGKKLESLSTPTLGYLGGFVQKDLLA